MNFKKKGAVAAVLLSGTLLFSGCSFSDVMDRWIGMEVDTVNESVDTSSSDQEVFTVDSSLEAPVFTRDLSGSMQMTVDSEYTLHVEASVSGGGTVTYQWYRNNTASNGGGTLLQGATGQDYTVDSSTTGTNYYYVVATNRQGDRIAMTTSGIQGVSVWDVGQWVQEQDGSWRYNLTDGTRPVSTWMIIEGQTYYFNEAGARVTGWFKVGDTEYYFNGEGQLQRNAATPDGGSTDENGARAAS